MKSVAVIRVGNGRWPSLASSYWIHEKIEAVVKNKNAGSDMMDCLKIKKSGDVSSRTAPKNASSSPTRFRIIANNTQMDPRKKIMFGNFRIRKSNPKFFNKGIKIKGNPGGVTTLLPI